MSARSFSEYFWIITGFTYKEYLVKRRLSESVLELNESNNRILSIALNYGYSSNEAFSRSFKKEFDISPNSFRELRSTLATLNKIELHKEKYMGVIVKSLNSMNGIKFDGYEQTSEDIAKEKLNRQLKANLEQQKYRVFGHNIDENGKLSNEIVIPPGKFVVTGIEGNFEDDADGPWIKDGWDKLSEMIKKKNFKIKEPSRCYEEELQPKILEI